MCLVSDGRRAQGVGCSSQGGEGAKGDGECSTQERVARLQVHWIWRQTHGGNVNF